MEGYSITGMGTCFHSYIRDNPKWYLEIELRHGIVNWEIMVDGFILIFKFEDDCPYIDLALQTVKKKIFENVTPMTWKQLDWAAQIENAVECYNLTTNE